HMKYERELTPNERKYCLNAGISTKIPEEYINGTVLDMTIQGDLMSSNYQSCYGNGSGNVTRPIKITTIRGQTYNRNLNVLRVDNLVSDDNSNNEFLLYSNEVLDNTSNSPQSDQQLVSRPVSMPVVELRPRRM